MSSRPRLLAIGPLPRVDSPVGGTQVSFSELVERLRASATFELRVLDTSRGATQRAAWLRTLDDAGALASTLLALARLAPRCDVVLFNASSGATTLAGPLIALTCRALRKPLAMRVFGGNLDLALERLPEWRRQLVERTVLRAPLLLLQTRALCRKLGAGANARQLATTRDVPRIERAAATSCTRFLFLSQLRPEKGFGDAIAAIERSRVDCTLTIAGPPMATTDAGSLKTSARVRYVGAVAPQDVPRLLAEHDVLVFPSRHEGEGLPGVMIEALQSGLPVIATRWRSLPELVEHERNGLLVEPGSIDELAAAIERLASDRELRQRLAIGALDVGARFRAAPWHGELEGWLLRLCGRSASSRHDVVAPASALPRRRLQRVARRS